MKVTYVKQFECWENVVCKSISKIIVCGVLETKGKVKKKEKDITLRTYRLICFIYSLPFHRKCWLISTKVILPRDLMKVTRDRFSMGMLLFPFSWPTRSSQEWRGQLHEQIFWEPKNWIKHKSIVKNLLKYF